MLSESLTHTIFVTNLYWKCILLIAIFSCLGFKLWNWRKQKTHGIGSFIMLIIVMLDILGALGTSLALPQFLCNPVSILTNIAYSAFILWYSWARCWPTPKGEATHNGRKMPIPMTFR